MDLREKNGCLVPQQRLPPSPAHWSLLQRPIHLPVETTSSMVYLMTMVSFTRKPLVGSSSSVRLTNLRYPWQFLALGSCRAQLILTAPASLVRPLVRSLPWPVESTGRRFRSKLIIDVPCTHHRCTMTRMHSHDKDALR